MLMKNRIVGLMLQQALMIAAREDPGVVTLYHPALDEHERIVVNCVGGSFSAVMYPKGTWMFHRQWVKPAVLDDRWEVRYDESFMDAKAQQEKSSEEETPEDIC